MVEGLNCNLFCIIEPRTSPLIISIHKLVTKFDPNELTHFLFDDLVVIDNFEFGLIAI